MQRRRNDISFSAAGDQQKSSKHSKTKGEKKKLLFKKWNAKQNLKYAQFLLENQEEMMTETSRRNAQVFKFMAKRIFKRNPEQCRTHHQKMFKKFGILQAIIDHFLSPEASQQSNQNQKGSQETENDEIAKKTTIEEVEENGNTLTDQLYSPLPKIEQDEEWCNCIEFSFISS